MSAGRHEPAASSTSASKTPWFSPAVSMSTSCRRSTAPRSRPSSPSVQRAWRSRCAMPNATCRDSSWRASCVTRREIGSGACTSRNPSRFRNVPSPSTDNKNEASAKSGSSSRVVSDARPPAPETPSGTPRKPARRANTSSNTSSGSAAKSPVVDDALRRSAGSRLDSASVGRPVNAPATWRRA